MKHAFSLIKSKKREIEFPYPEYQKKNNCIFIHIPKVAGTSILDVLGKKEGGRDHLPWYVYYTANPYYFNSAFKFAFVRNPWCRALSAYLYLKKGGNGKGDSKLFYLISEYKNFDSFVINGLGEGYFRNHLLFLPQSEFIVNGEGEVVVDYLGRYENIESDFAFVLRKLSLSGYLPKKNEGAKNFSGYKEAYSSKDSIDIIHEIYKQDIMKFGYEF